MGLRNGLTFPMIGFPLKSIVCWVRVSGLLLCGKRSYVAIVLLENCSRRLCVERPRDSGVSEALSGYVTGTRGQIGCGKRPVGA